MGWVPCLDLENRMTTVNPDNLSARAPVPPLLTPRFALLLFNAGIFGLAFSTYFLLPKFLAVELAADAAAGAAGDVVGESADAAAEAATATDAATAAAAAASTVPAGWYADPSGRYELRYWDGNAWTEHVSRAGQQFTDPPVA